MMKRKSIYIIIMFLIIGLGIVFSDMITNSRYYLSVDVNGTPNLASTYFSIATTGTDSNPVSISPGGNTTVHYNLTNKVDTNRNTNKLNFYLKLLNESGNESTDTNKIIISSVKIENTTYSYINGKGFGPIDNLSYDNTDDTKTFDITLSCNVNYTPTGTLAYKISILAEDPVDSTKYTTKTADLNIEVATTKYTVTFNSNGGTDVSSQSIVDGGKVTEPSGVTRSGYRLLGWYKESELTNLWNFSTDTVTSNITLYAKWVKTYTVTFNSNGGTSIASQTVDTGSKITEPTDPTKSGGYVFDGWYKESGLTNLWNFDTDIVTNDIILYANWDGPYFYFQLPPDWFTQENVYVYLFNKNDGSIKNATWRGVKMSELDSTKKIFAYNLKGDSNIENYTHCIFNYTDRQGTTYRQTGDLEFSTENLGKIWVPKLYNESNKIRLLGYGGSGLYLHYWNESITGSGTTWPGNPMTTISGSGGYGILDTSKYDTFIFNAGSSSMQTNNLNIASTLKSHQDLTIRLTSNRVHKITRFFYMGDWESYDNWLSSGYNTWKANDYVKFNNAQSAFGYAIGY